MKDYCVTVARTGCAFVKASSPEKAMEIVNSLPTHKINWTDEWEVTYVEEDQTLQSI